MVYRQQLPIWPLTLIAFAAALAYLPLPFLALTLGAVTSFVLLIRWPWLIWVGIAAILPVSSGLKIGLLSLTDLMLFIAIGLWFAKGVRQRTLQLKMRGQVGLLLFPLFLYVSISILSLFNATDLGEAVAEVIKWVEFAIILLLVPQMMPPERRHWLVIALLSGAIGQSLLGFYQFINQIGPPWFMILGRFMRASGSFSQPNPYAGYLGLTLPVAVSLLFWSLRTMKLESLQQFKKNSAHFTGQWAIVISHAYYRSIFYGVIAAFIGMAMLASWSRGGWLGALFGVGLVSALSSRRFAVASAVALLVLLSTFMMGGLSVNILSTVLPAPIMARIQDLPAYFGLTDVLNQPLTDENFAVVERMAHWIAALRMWEQAPWLGVGPGNYATIYPSVRIPFWEEPLGHAHNIYLNTLGETGVLGFIAYLCFWGATTAWSFTGWINHRVNWHRHPTEVPSWDAALTLGVSGVLLHLAVHNFFDNLFVQGMYLHVGLWLAILLIKRNPLYIKQN